MLEKAFDWIPTNERSEERGFRQERSNNREALSLSSHLKRSVTLVGLTSFRTELCCQYKAASRDCMLLAGPTMIRTSKAGQGILAQERQSEATSAARYWSGSPSNERDYEVPRSSLCNFWPLSQQGLRVVKL